MKLYNEDCIEVLKYMPDESIDLIVTDPPYKLTPRGTAGTMGGYWKSKKAKERIGE